MKDSYKHGVLWQDHQHQQLLKAITDLNKKRGTVLESAELNKTITFLELYVKSHFDLEEYYMQSLAYPEIRKHKEQHAEFTEYIKAFKLKVRSSNDPGLLLNGLCNWLQDHIMGIDKELAEFIKTRTGDV